MTTTTSSVDTIIQFLTTKAPGLMMVLAFNGFLWLSSRTENLRVDVVRIDGDVRRLKEDMKEVRSDIKEIKKDVSDLKSDVAEIKASLKILIDRKP